VHDRTSVCEKESLPNFGLVVLVLLSVCLSVCLCICAAEMQQLDSHRWFGQAGSGAALKDAHGNLLADYSSRQVNSSHSSHSLLTHLLTYSLTKCLSQFDFVISVSLLQAMQV